MTQRAGLEKIIDMALLADFYGALLTDKQKQALQLFYEEDFSLGEIAAACTCTRQAAHDLIKRSEALLTDYEQKLHLVKRYRERKHLLAEAERELAALGIERSQPVAKDFWNIWEEIIEE